MRFFFFTHLKLITVSYSTRKKDISATYLFCLRGTKYTSIHAQNTSGVLKSINISIGEKRRKPETCKFIILFKTALRARFHVLKIYHVRGARTGKTSPADIIPK